MAYVYFSAACNKTTGIYAHNSLLYDFLDRAAELHSSSLFFPLGLVSRRHYAPASIISKLKLTPDTQE